VSFSYLPSTLPRISRASEVFPAQDVAPWSSNRAVSRTNEGITGYTGKRMMGFCKRDKTNK